MLDDKILAALGDKAAADRLTERGKLLPCPMCAGKADSWEDTGNRKGFVQCVDCDLLIQNVSKEAAEADWNTRAPILTPEKIKRLEEME